MLEAVQHIAELVARTDRDEFSRDGVLQDALMRTLETLGEAAGRLSRQFTMAHPDVPWREITGLRHKLIHDYFEVDLSVVWGTATKNVPQLEPQIRRLLREFPDDTSQ